MKKFICILLILTMLPLTVLSAPEGLGEYLITASSLNVRSEPVSGSERIGMLYMGAKVHVYEISGYWGRIDYNGREGWISLNYAVHTESKVYSMSEDGLNMLKRLEGFAAQKYWDYQQWSIGYGTACGEDEYPDGITEAEASELLVKVLERYEAYVDTFLNNNNIEVTQPQYDALVSFTYNLGNLWVREKDFTLRTMLIEGISVYTEEEIKAAFGEFVSAGGVVSNGLIYRRSVEADMFLSGTTIQEPVNNFEDVSDTAWYADEVSFCLRKGYMKGMSETLFSPNTNVTREQFVLILANMAGVDTDVYKEVDSGMTDVQTGVWYSGAVTWAVQSGYVSGVAQGVFGTGQPIQRAALARLLYLYAEQLGKDIMADSDVGEFADGYLLDDRANSWMVAPVCWAVDKGIISGVARDGKSYIDPKATATRAQTARMLMQFDSLK